MNPKIEHLTGPDTPTTPPPYSAAVRCNGFIFVAGQASTDATGEIVPDTFEGEFKRSIENVRKVLEAAGSDLSHVVQTRNYVRDAADLDLYNKLYRAAFPQPYPARTTIVNCLPADLRYEIEAIAVAKG